MTIQDAIKSGKDFTRPEMKVWLKIIKGDSYKKYSTIVSSPITESLVDTELHRPIFLGPRCLLATDWEVKKAVVKKEGWVNLYSSTLKEDPLGVEVGDSGIIYKTEASAFEDRNLGPGYLDTIKITWTEEE